MGKFQLPKSHRLCSAREIEQLFSSAAYTSKKYPFLFHWFWSDSGEYHRFLPMVSKRRFSKATDRNRIKRQIRELWRLNRHLVNNRNGHFLVLGVTYLAKVKLPYRDMEAAFLYLIRELNETH